ncbi:hypothetical protein tb265_05540 [Gemmatimonadetes bacterium T265]|nr:hypothetical protein tb265_05540 [Gemmatimonadetes bacterium T265]
MVGAAALAAAAAAATGTVPHPVRAQGTQQDSALSPAALDSVRAGLAAADWNDRHAALARINGAYATALPPSLVAPVLALLDREAATSHADADEEFGEYLVDLLVAAANTRDVRATPGIIRLGGLGVGSGIAAFVASQGRAVMPTLDSLVRASDDHASDVVETYALMYARYGARLTRADSAHALRHLLAATRHPWYSVRMQVAMVAARGGIVELLPAVDQMARADSERVDGAYVVRRAAAEAVLDLQPARAALPTGVLLDQLRHLTDAACEGAGDRLSGRCVALNAYLSTALRGLSERNPAAAANVLALFRTVVQRLATDGLLPRAEAVSLDGAAAAVVDRLLAAP